MPVGPKRFAPLSKKVAKKPVLRPRSVQAGYSGITGDKRPSSTQSNLQRAAWGIDNRSDKGDWT